MPDTQPFQDPAGRYSFSHNGDLADYRGLRRTYREQGRIHGRADTEVGARWLEDAWRDDEPVAHLLAALHDRFKGDANLAVLTADGEPHHYAGNDENPVFTFRLGRIGVASTGIYSLDRSLFRFVAPTATARQLVRAPGAVTLDPDRGAGRDLLGEGPQSDRREGRRRFVAAAPEGTPPGNEREVSDARPARAGGPGVLEADRRRCRSATSSASPCTGWA